MWNMKRFFRLVPLLAVLALPATALRAQNNASLLAEKQEIEEKYKSLSAAVQALQESNSLLQKKLDAALAELNNLKDKTAKPPVNAVTQEDLKHLAEKIVELDNKRIADNKRIVETIAELGKTLKTPAAPVKPPKAPEPAASRNEKGYEYEIASGDSLTKIVKAYRDNGIKVSQKAIEDANPDVQWTKLKIGQKIWIPAPKE
jgi:hypothetical protein